MVQLKYLTLCFAVGVAVDAAAQSSATISSSVVDSGKRSVYTGAFDTYGSMGFTVGTPAVVNVVIGRSWNRLGFRISGMYLGELVAGLQGNFVYNFYRRHAFSQSLSIGGGYGVMKNFGVYYSPQPQYPGEIPMGGGPDHNHWTYAGISYNWNWAGFFLEVGVTVVHLYSESIPMFFQIGYVHEGP